MGCGKKTEPIDTATNSATLEMAGTHWQLTVDDQGNAVWTAARSAGAEGPDTDRARDLKLSASVDVSELATDPMACGNPDQASFSGRVPGPVVGPSGPQRYGPLRPVCSSSSAGPRAAPPGPWCPGPPGWRTAWLVPPEPEAGGMVGGLSGPSAPGRAARAPRLGSGRSDRRAAGKGFLPSEMTALASERGGLQGADDPAGGMRRAHLGPGGEPPAVLRGVQGPHGPHWRPGSPGGGEGQLALQHEAVVGRRSPRLSADGPDIRPRGGEGDEGIVYPPITADNVHGVVGKDYRKKNYPVEMKHVFWAHMECGLVLSSGNSSRRQKGRPGGATCVRVLWASSRSGPARPSCSWCWTSRRRASTTAG